MIRPRRTTALDEVVPVRVPPRSAEGALRPGLGGVGWRPGVPHIIIHMGDTDPVCAFTPGYVVPEFMPPAAADGVEVPVAFLRPGSTSWNEGDEYRDGYFFDLEEAEPYWAYTYATVAEDVSAYERSGPAGEWWVGPRNMATLPETLDALATLDIGIITICGLNVMTGTSVFFPAVNEFSYSALLGQYENNNEHKVADPLLSDLWGGGNARGILGTGAALAFLTGAVSDSPAYGDPGSGPTAMAYTWGSGGTGDDPRWTRPTPTNAVAFVNFLIPKVLELAEKKGNANSFDIACCIDNSGSFSSLSNTAKRVFLDLIEALQGLGKDIYVGVSKFSEYATWTYPYADGGNHERPYILQFPVGPVNDDAAYASMIAAVNDSPPGGGGDTPETQYEAFYQIASGAGMNGDRERAADLPQFNLPNVTTRSGVAGERGIPSDEGAVVPPDDYAPIIEYIQGLTGWSLEEYHAWRVRYNEWYFDADDPGGPEGVGFMLPGSTGDVPAYGAVSRTPRGAGTVATTNTRIWSYPNRT